MPKKTYIASAPSNIALIKYWGKKDAKLQVPANESLSMTLSNCMSITACSVQTNQESGDSILIENQLQPFDHKIYSFIRLAKEAFGMTESLKITSMNTFPQSCGIASSASGYAALTLAICGLSFGAKSIEEIQSKGWSMERLSQLARMGSGSACRSLLPGFVHWQLEQENNQQKVISLKSRLNVVDIIAVVDSSEKKISSSAGHLNAWTSPLFSTRLAGIEEKIAQLTNAIQVDDFRTIGRIAEHDALEMHSVMMSQTPGCFYMTKKSQEIMAWVRQDLRQKNNLPAYFTLDAGPNVHVLCLEQDQKTILEKLRIKFPELKLVIADHKGEGPSLKSKDLEYDDLDLQRELKAFISQTKPHARLDL